MPYPVKEFTYKDILWIASESNTDDDSLVTITEEEALRNSEEILQLKEGCSYEYELLDENSSLSIIPGIIHQSKKSTHRGRITPGNYAGRLPLNIIISPDKNTEIAVEVRSSKSDYRSEYRKMLEDIASECADLLMIHSSPVTQRFSADSFTSSETMYQRFSFVQSMVNSDDFCNAVMKVISLPVTRWKTVDESADSRKIRRPASQHIRQFASASSRLPLPDNHPLSNKIESIPRKLNTEIKKDTTDNPENRFIKHALSEFAAFCASVCAKIDGKYSGTKPDIYYEAKKLESKLSEYLSHNVFREVSCIDSLPLNNPVLQRKEGYREIFRTWLMYDLAAKLSWDGLDPDTYDAGKRDAASLYEYWLFFKLLRMIEQIFEIKPAEKEKLIQETGDGLGLQLKAGRHTAIEGSAVHKNRHLKIKFNYNRTFSYSDFPCSGSWTQKMRPDYTLSFWPADFAETEAEEQELIVHIHFDAKYKVEDLKYMLNGNIQAEEDKDIEDLNSEKELEKTGKYKRADLLKMHAYKDAIRRTAGAYILYPGSVNSKPYRGFHELIPGLGAFAVCPSSADSGIDEVKKFIMSVLDHYADRNTLRETHSFYTYKIMSDSKIIPVRERIPEYSELSGRRLRSKPVSETDVLAGFVQQKQKEWILRNGYYNIRIDKEITPEIAGADYLLLYDRLDGNRLCFWHNGLFKIKGSPVLRSKEWLLEKGYPNPSRLEYFVYEISGELEAWSESRITELLLGKYEDNFGPFTRKSSSLIKK